MRSSPATITSRQVAAHQIPGELVHGHRARDQIRRAIIPDPDAPAQIFAVEAQDLQGHVPVEPPAGQGEGPGRVGRGVGPGQTHGRAAEHRAAGDAEKAPVHGFHRQKGRRLHVAVGPGEELAAAPPVQLVAVEGQVGDGIEVIRPRPGEKGHIPGAQRRRRDGAHILHPQGLSVDGPDPPVAIGRGDDRQGAAILPPEQKAGIFRKNAPVLPLGTGGQDAPVVQKINVSPVVPGKERFGPGRVCRAGELPRLQHVPRSVQLKEPGSEGIGVRRGGVSPGEEEERPLRPGHQLPGLVYAEAVLPPRLLKGAEGLQHRRILPRRTAGIQQRKGVPLPLGGVIWVPPFILGSCHRVGITDWSWTQNRATGRRH